MNFSAKGLPFSLGMRPWWRYIYDLYHPEILVMGGRQIEKSTFIGNALASESCLARMNYIYASSTYNHVKRFHRDRLTDTFYGNKLIRRNWTNGPQCTNNQHMIILANLSSIDLITLRGNGDTARGIPGDRLYMDELQDITAEAAGVARECLSHAVDGGRIIYTGTPKTIDNVLAQTYYNKTTAEEWLVKCDVCGKHNVLGLANVAREGIICANCYRVAKKKRLINVLNGEWMATHQLGMKRYIRGFRMPQILLKALDPADIYLRFYIKVLNADPITLYNEILGMPYDSSDKPLHMSDFKFVPPDKMKCIDDIQKTYYRYPMFIGIDWGLGKSYTVFTIIAIIDGKPTVVYYKKYSGIAETKMEWQLNDIIKNMKKVGFKACGVDWGVGAGYQNPKLQQIFGYDRIFQIYNSGTQYEMIKWNNKKRQFSINRDGQIQKLFQEIRDGDLKFVAKHDVVHCLQDFLNVNIEYRRDIRGDVEPYYTHDDDKPDDAVHSTMYARIASSLSGRH